MFHWTGDLKDDCKASWNGLLLHAEEMDRNVWWWGVTNQANENVASSNDNEIVCKSGKVARAQAQRAALVHLVGDSGVVLDHHQLALLEVIRSAVLRIRVLGYVGQESGLSKHTSELVADIADAIHNIPGALSGHEYDLEFQLEIMLKGLKEKHPDNIDLLGVYRNRLTELQSSA